MGIKVAIHTGYDYPEYYEIFKSTKQYLIENGISCEIIPMIGVCSEEDTIKYSKGYDVVMASHEPYTEKVFKELSPTLRMVSKLGIGIDTIEVDSASKYGVIVTNTPGANASAVADMAVTLMLAVNRNLMKLNNKLKSCEWWTGYLGGQMEDFTIGLVGFGGIAQIVARYLTGFGCKILAYDPYFNSSVGKRLGVKQVDLNELSRCSDIVSVHVPLTTETIGMINSSFLQNMKKTAFLVNTSRGPVVNEKDLIEALINKVIAGAGLDVFEREPLNNDSPLLKMENVIVTPHVAGNSKSAVSRVATVAADNVIAFSENKEIKNAINIEALNSKC